MKCLIQRFDHNPEGRDFAVGDIHGHFSRLQSVLERIRFDPARDRLFSVGDLVDRGPESEESLKWLEFPWFHAVRGNHEDIAIRYAKGNPVDASTYSHNGGDWFMALDDAAQRRFAKAFDGLPYAIEVQTESGLVGLVHAHVPTRQWSELRELLSSSRYNRDRVIWDRGRIQLSDTSHVAGVRAVVVGHTPLPQVAVLGNVHHIDTAGWTKEGRFTLLDLSTLEAV